MNSPALTSPEPPVDPDEAGGDAAYFEDSARVATLFGLLGDIAGQREKVLIFCESLAMQALLAAEIRRRFDLPHLVTRIHGGVTGDQRQAAVDTFQARPAGFDAMILSPKAGGVGLTLKAANHVIHLSRWWNPAVEPAPPPQPVPRPESRSRLSRPRPEPVVAAAPERPAWPTRTVYQPGMARDLAIFRAPLADDPAVEIHIVDPYAVAGDRARNGLVEFAALLTGSQADAVQHVRLVTYDADSVDLTPPETSQHQYQDLQVRWQARFGDRPPLLHMQRSKRQARDLHDREVRARTRSGRTLIWDLGRGVDGVMSMRFGCRVTLTEE